jgi:WD40 repeat protein
VAFHSTAPLLATGSANGIVKIWKVSDDLSSATCVETLEGHIVTVSSMLFHPTKPILATGSWDNTVRLYLLSEDSSSATCVSMAKMRDRGFVTSLAFNPTASYFVTGSTSGLINIYRILPDYTLELLNIQNQNRKCILSNTGGGLISLPNSVATVNTIAFDPDGSMMASGNSKGSVFLYTIKDGVPSTCKCVIRERVGIDCVSFQKDQCELFAIANEEVVVFNLHGHAGAEQ